VSNLAFWCQNLAFWFQILPFGFKSLPFGLNFKKGAQHTENLKTVVAPYQIWIFGK